MKQRNQVKQMQMEQTRRVKQISLSDAMRTLAKQAAGSFKTVHDRINIMNRFECHLKQLNIQIKHIDHLKTRHIQGYIAHRLEQGIGKRTLQNEMAAIRAVLQRAGRVKLAQSILINNSALGIGNASRAGTKVAISEVTYQGVFEAALQRNEGLAAAIELSRVLGLRSQEAVQCSQSLKTWQKALERGDARLSVVFGTKGGRPRETIIVDRERVQQAVSFALQITQQQNGKLVDKPNLKQAMSYWRNHTTALGLVGKYSPHSLRYAWAQDAIAHYQKQGYSAKEAQALTSMDLGHGDGRGRYVARVYGLTGDDTKLFTGSNTT